MKKIFFVLCSFLLVAVPVFADFDKSKWEFRKPIRGEAGSAYVLVDLDEEVFDRANETLSDLRIIDRDGREMPYTIAAEGDRSSLVSLGARMFNKSFVPGASSEFTLDLGSAGQFHNRLTIQTNSENFRRMVEVEGSNDGSSWRYLTTRGQIYDYTVRDEIKPVSVQDTSVEYPESTVRYLRVRILDRQEAPLQISGASVYRRVDTVARESVFRPKLSTSENSELRATEIVADLGVRGIPTRKAELNISDVNFNRTVEIFASNDSDKNWRQVSTHYIFRVNTEKFQGENTTLQYPEVQTRYVKFVVYNRDDRSLSVKDISLSGILRKLVFKPENGGSYSLYYGNRDARRPEYDIERLFPYLDPAGMNHWALEREEKNPDFAPAKPPLTERNKYLLPIALGIIVAILAFLLLRIFTTRQEEPKPEGV